MEFAPRPDDFRTPRDAFERALCEQLISRTVAQWPRLAVHLDREWVDGPWWSISITDAERPFDYRTVLSEPRVEGRIAVVWAEGSGEPRTWWETDPQPHAPHRDSNYGEYQPMVFSRAATVETP